MGSRTPDPSLDRSRTRPPGRGPLPLAAASLDKRRCEAACPSCCASPHAHEHGGISRRLTLLRRYESGAVSCAAERGTFKASVRGVRKWERSPPFSHLISILFSAPSLPNCSHLFCTSLPEPSPVFSSTAFCFCLPLRFPSSCRLYPPHLFGLEIHDERLDDSYVTVKHRRRPMGKAIPPSPPHRWTDRQYSRKQDGESEIYTHAYSHTHTYF